MDSCVLAAKERVLHQTTGMSLVCPEGPVKSEACRAGSRGGSISHDPEVADGRSAARLTAHVPRTTISFILLAALGLAFTGPAVAQAHPISCGFFDTRQDTRAALDANPDLAEVLDADGNGRSLRGSAEPTGMRNQPHR